MTKRPGIGPRSPKSPRHKFRPGFPDNRGMNPLLAKLQPYPFERLKQLFASVTPKPTLGHISLGIGEPKHATPAFIQEALKNAVATGL